MRIIAAFIAFLEVFLYSVGIFSAGSDVSYTSSNYSAPKIRNEMKLVENGGSSFSIVIPEKSDATLKTAAKELQTYIKKNQRSNARDNQRSRIPRFRKRHFSRLDRLLKGCSRKRNQKP